ncbi:LuxR C-terminal-related transcriptional regulator [Nocardia sp. NPDC004582]
MRAITAYQPPQLSFSALPLTAAQTTLNRAHATGNGHTVLVCAPAGAGKSVQVAEWIRRLHHRVSDLTTGWLALAEPSLDPARLWQHAAAALGLHPPSTAPAMVPGPVAEAAELVAALGRRSAPAVLVIDDAHLLTDPLLLAGLEYFLDHAPRSLTTIVIGRFDPPLPWHGIDMTGRLTRISFGELTFGDPQIADLLAQHGCRPDASDIAAIRRLTCGWAALVRIAAIHLAAHAESDRATAIATLSRTPHGVADFLVGELLDTLPAEALDFLLATAVPASFPLDLARELTGDDAPRVLDGLLRGNFPMERNARDGLLWHTYHPMLRAHLLAEAARRPDTQLPRLHRTCARWFAESGMRTLALQHVLAEPGQPGLAAFVRDHGPRLVFDGAGAGLLRHLDDLELRDDPFTRLLHVADALERGDAVHASMLMEVVRDRTTALSAIVDSATVDALTAAVTVAVDQASGGSVTARPRSATPATTGHPDLDCYIALHFGTAATFGPELALGEAGLRRALALAERGGPCRLGLQALTQLAMAAGLAGRFTAMRERATHAVRFAERHGLTDWPAVTHARVMIATTAYLQGEPDTTRTGELLPTVLRLDGSTAPAPGWHAAVLAHLVASDTATDRQRAAEAMRVAMHRLLDEAAVPTATGGLLTHVLWSLLRIRAPEAMRALLDHAVSRLGHTPETIVADAALADHAQRAATAVELLEPVLRQGDRSHPITMIHAWLIRASACDRLDRPAKVHEALRRALEYAQPDRLIRPFLDVPAAVELLDQFVGRFGHLDPLVETIRQHPRARPQDRTPNLTDTELIVLRQLPSGMTTLNIAADMGVSINTVKTHLRGIYHKLDVRARADAITRARTFGLI